MIFLNYLIQYPSKNLQLILQIIIFHIQSILFNSKYEYSFYLNLKHFKYLHKQIQNFLIPNKRMIYYKNNFHLLD
jgi:hypothetical protein